MKKRGMSFLLCLALLVGMLSAGLCLSASAATADPPHEHVFTEEFNYSNEKGHGRICRACGDFATLKDFEPHVPGPAATETEPQVCTECGRILAWPTGETFEDADLGFSVQPFVKSAETTGNTAMICFGCSHADKLTGWSLWRDEHGDHWKKMGDADSLRFIAPAGNEDGLYEVYLPTLFDDAAEEERYMVRLEYLADGDPVEVESVMFTVTKEMTEKHEHVFTEEFNYSDSKGHGRICRACGDFATLRDYEPHVPGPAATETEPQVCLECGRILARAAGTKTETDPTHEHVFTEYWNYSNAEGHGRICRACGDFATLRDFTPHVPGPAATATEPQTCTECGRILAWPTGIEAPVWEEYTEAGKVYYVEREEIEEEGTAYESVQPVEEDGKERILPAHALHDQNGNPTNYVRLRDLAALLRGTAAEFDVIYDPESHTITILPRTAYRNPNGTEGKVPFTGDQPYQAYLEDTVVNGRPAHLTAFTIEYQGGGHTYYKLRDLAKALGFNVGWSAERGIYIETGKAYTDDD